MQRFLEWQKSILIFSTVLTVILTLIAFVLSPLAVSHMGVEAPKAREILHLTLGGWVGWFGIGTIINILATLMKWVFHSFQKHTNSH